MNDEMATPVVRPRDGPAAMNTGSRGANIGQLAWKMINGMRKYQPIAGLC